MYVDGVYTESVSGKFYLPPGKRQLGLGASIAGGAKAYTIIELDVQPNTNYDFRVEKEDDNFQMANIYVDKKLVSTKKMTMHYGVEYKAGEEVKQLLLKEIKASGYNTSNNEN